MALTPERIRELWENYSPTQGIESFARSVEAAAIESQSREIAALKAQEAELCTLYGLAEAECKRLRKDAERWRAVENATVDLTARLHMADKSKRTEVIDAAIAAKGGSDASA